MIPPLRHAVPPRHDASLPLAHEPARKLLSGFPGHALPSGDAESRSLSRQEVASVTCPPCRPRPLALAALAVAALAAAIPPAQAAGDEYAFAAAPQTDLNRIYRIDRYTGEVSACQYAIKDGTIGVTLCYPAGEGAGPQSGNGTFDLVPSHHEREGGIFRVNRRTGAVSVCYVLSERVVCTPPSG
jgi:hypothetical protein